jgi:type II secretory pathway component PulF
VLDALHTLAESNKGARAAFAASLLERVKGGATLAEAMAASTQVPEEHAAIIEAGERSGAIDRCLARIVERIDHRREMVAKYRPRAAYQACTLVMAVMLLPIQLVILGQAWKYLLIQILFFGPLAILWILVRRGPALFDRHDALRRSFERLVLGTPWIGRLVTESVVGKAAGLLGILLEAGLSLRDALPLVTKTIRWDVIADGFRSLEPGIRSGKTFAEALRELPAFAAESTWLARIAVGEKAGTLDHAFLELGESLETHARAKAQKGLGFLYIVVLFLVAAMVLAQGIGAFSALSGGF